MTRGFHKAALPAKTLMHLADTGPMERDALDKYMRTLGSDRNAWVAFSRLKDAGFVKVKVWLTPEGLAELKRLGWTPDVGEAENDAEPEAAAA